jgi:hypothetical protein
MVYVATKPLERIARDSHAMMQEVAKGLAAHAAGKDEMASSPEGWSQFLVGIRAAELAVLLTSVDRQEQQLVADQINEMLGFTGARFRLTPIA